MNNLKGKFIAKYKTTLLSTGVASLDNLIGGGLSVGTITLFEEDCNNIHCEMLCKHIISCGLTNGQDTALVIDYIKPESYLERLPKIITNQPTVQSNMSSELEIAWRYKTLKNVEEFVSPSMENDSTIGVDMKKISTHHVTKDLLSENLSDVLGFVENFMKSKGGPRKPLRIVISSLGSPFWGSASCLKEDVRKNMCKFLFSLKRLIYGTFVSVIVTLNPDLLHDTNGISSVLHTYTDYVFKFDAFDDPKSVGKKLHHDVTGLMKPLRIPSINSIEPIFKPNTLIWSYHILRRRIMFKEFSLPPCLSDTVSRSSQNNPSETIHVKMGCGVDF